MADELIETKINPVVYRYENTGGLIAVVQSTQFRPIKGEWVTFKEKRYVVCQIEMNFDLNTVYVICSRGM